MSYNERRVQALKRDLEAGVKEIKEEAEYNGMELSDCDAAFDLSIGVALGAETKEDAEEFLRREWGYVPNQFKQLTKPTSKDA